MDVAFNKIFKSRYANLPDSDKKKIFAFYQHVQQKGLTLLEGRNKNSDNVPKDDPDFLAKVQYAQANKLWHYHIGIEKYDMQRPFGARTSEWILHYINDVPTCIKIADLDSHPPFSLPAQPFLEE
ncbi:hypothetical protein Q0A17_04290 [Citrobacter sp. S2-9]|uniref:Uncharacterized protein n=1 Tax=Citrobacter enshiensis TaxID=2971264 RepID=A0ABT8PRN1_9ENTR|nr:hypothetical protein [Citrobacter enshiensis]MDN8598642.1 hypothetical protein [Citrobacter enshiensis]